MPNPFHYRAVLNRLARLTEATNPAHVRVSAAIAMSKELLPGTERARLAQRMLRDANPFEFARHQLRDLYDGPGTLCPVSVDAAPAGVTDLDEEDAPDEPEDPL